MDRWTEIMGGENALRNGDNLDYYLTAASMLALQRYLVTDGASGFFIDMNEIAKDESQEFSPLMVNRLYNELKMVAPRMVHYVDHYICITDPEAFFETLDKAVIGGKSLLKVLVPKLGGKHHTCELSIDQLEAAGIESHHDSTVEIHTSGRLNYQDNIRIDIKTGQNRETTSSLAMTLLDTRVAFKIDNIMAAFTAREMLGILTEGVFQERDFGFMNKKQNPGVNDKAEVYELAYTDRNRLIARYPETAAAFKAFDQGRSRA